MSVSPTLLKQALQEILVQDSMTILDGLLSLDAWKKLLYDKYNFGNGLDFKTIKLKKAHGYQPNRHIPPLCSSCPDTGTRRRVTLFHVTKPGKVIQKPPEGHIFKEDVQDHGTTLTYQSRSNFSK
jgi:hypothetical protein